MVRQTDKLRDRSLRSEEDWWALPQLARRWRCSVAKLKRRIALPAADTQHVKAMPHGATHLVHWSEIQRHEEKYKSIPLEKEMVAKPEPFVPRLGTRRQQARERIELEQNRIGAADERKMNADQGVKK